MRDKLESVIPEAAKRFTARLRAGAPLRPISK
jgi:hypothetical protein